MSARDEHSVKSPTHIWSHRSNSIRIGIHGIKCLPLIRGKGSLKKINIRRETEADITAINEITAAAFKDHPYSHQTEVFIIKALRAANALTLSLVAEIGGRVVGHIAFSPVVISDGSKGWYGIGPLSVAPEFQRQGIGKALVNEGLATLNESGANGCVLVGDPDYYKRFGFRNLPELTLEGVPPENFLALAFGKDSARDAVSFHEAFLATG